MTDSEAKLKQKEDRRLKRAKLRSLETLAYSSALSYLRAKNDYNKESELILAQLRCLLHISDDRHMAELKRIINNDELQQIISTVNFGQIGLSDNWKKIIVRKQSQETSPKITTTSMKKKRTKNKNSEKRK